MTRKNLGTLALIIGLTIYGAIISVQGIEKAAYAYVNHTSEEW